MQFSTTFATLFFQNATLNLALSILIQNHFKVAFITIEEHFRIARFITLEINRGFWGFRLLKNYNGQLFKGFNTI